MNGWVEVQGLKEFENQLKRLDESMQRKQIMSLIRRVAGPVEKAAKLEAAMIETRALQAGRITTGNLEDSIGRIRGKAKEYPNIQVAPRAKGRFKGFHAQLVQFGTSVRKTRTGANRGAAKPDPFMTRAFNKTLNSVRADFEKQIAKQVEKNAKTIFNGTG